MLEYVSEGQGKGEDDAPENEELADHMRANDHHPRSDGKLGILNWDTCENKELADRMRAERVETICPDLHAH
eukprot:1137412-Pelagomonas_calceolata.AAC.2